MFFRNYLFQIFSYWIALILLVRPISVLLYPILKVYFIFLTDCCWEWNCWSNAADRPNITWCKLVSFVQASLVHIYFDSLSCWYSALPMFMQQDFFRKLMDLFRICEDLENIDGLHMIYKIVRGISKFSSLLLYVV